jgi:hypothetical protein
MTTQLIGQIIALAGLGLLLFTALAYIVARTAEWIFKYYFAAKLAYTLMLMKHLHDTDEQIEALLQKSISGIPVGKHS